MKSNVSEVIDLPVAPIFSLYIIISNFKSLLWFFSAKNSHQEMIIHRTPLPIIWYYTVLKHAWFFFIKQNNILNYTEI